MFKDAVMRGNWVRTSRRTLATTLALAALVGVACTSDRPTSEGVGVASFAVVNVSGTVRSETGSRVADVAIELRDSSGNVVATALSAADGTYALEPVAAEIPDGIYDLIANPPEGSAYGSQIFKQLDLNGTSTFDVVLARPNYNVTGNLVDGEGKPVEGLQVCLSATVQTCMTTAQEGHFGFMIPDGNYNLLVYGTRSNGNQWSYIYLSSTSSIAVTGYTPLGTTKLPTRTIAVEVRLPDGSPAFDAVVGTEYVPLTSGALSGYWSGSAAAPEGSVNFEAYEGSGSLVASVPDFAATSQSFSETQTNVVMELGQGYLVQGRLVGRDSAPLSSLDVCLEGTTRTCSRSEDDGTFALLVTAGTYAMRFSGSRSSPDQSNYLYLTRQAAVQVTGDLLLGDVVLPTRTLNIQLQTSDGVPASDASINVSSISINDAEYSGYWSGSALAPSGTVAFEAYEGSGQLVATATGLASSVQIAEKQANLSLQLDAGALMTGRLLGDGPLGDFQVCLSAGQQFCARTDTVDGAFSLRVPDGSYWMQVYGLQNSEKAWEGWTYLHLGSNNQLELIDDLPFGDIQLPAYPLTIQVVDVDGKRLGGAIASVDYFPISSDQFSGYWSGSATSNDQGLLKLHGFEGAGAVRITPSENFGLSGFLIPALELSGPHWLGVSLQFRAEDASGSVPLGGTISTDGEDDGATPADPVETLIERPNAGTGLDDITISERQPTLDPPDFGYLFVTQQVSIFAQGSACTTDPLEITFRIDCSRFYPAPCDQTTADSVVVYRNAKRVCACGEASDTCPASTIGAVCLPAGPDGVATPDPCFQNRTIVDNDNGGGDVSITVLTTAASEWNFAFKLPGDADNDRIPDADDACPTEPEDLDGNEDTDGCPEIEDADGDLVPDFDDACPNDAEDVDGNEDTDGCPEIEDTDGDGLDDLLDACPSEAEDFDGNADTDGCPEIEDEDNDGIPDATDACPTEAEDIDGNADMDGCPETEPKPVRCADFDRDGRVTQRDLRELIERIGARKGSRRYRAIYDLNDNGYIGYLDLALARQQLGKRCPRGRP